MGERRWRQRWTRLLRCCSEIVTHLPVCICRLKNQFFINPELVQKSFLNSRLNVSFGFLLSFSFSRSTYFSVSLCWGRNISIYWLFWNEITSHEMAFKIRWFWLLKNMIFGSEMSNKFIANALFGMESKSDNTTIVCRFASQWKTSILRLSMTQVLRFKKKWLSCVSQWHVASHLFY